MIEHPRAQGQILKLQLSYVVRVVRQRDVEQHLHKEIIDILYTVGTRKKRRKEKHHDGMINVLLYKNEEKEILLYSISTLLQELQREAQVIIIIRGEREEVPHSKLCVSNLSFSVALILTFRFHSHRFAVSSPRFVVRHPWFSRRLLLLSLSSLPHSVA